MKRLSSIDGLRGLVVVLMVMHHSLDAWVREPERHGLIWKMLRLLGGIPAPGFLLLAGLSVALVASRERLRGLAARDRAWHAIKRGLYILGIGFSFRIAAFMIDGNHWDEWYILFRVNILNCMGVALAIVGALCAIPRTRNGSIAMAVVLGAPFLLATPLIQGREFQFPAIYLDNYISGRMPLAMFPLVPWLSFVALGYGIGEYLGGALVAKAVPGEVPNATIARAFRAFFAIGLCMFSASTLLGMAPFNLYPPHDYFNASPIFFALRMGVQFMLLGAFAWWWRYDSTGERGAFLQLLGRHSLFVYLVHLEFVYGRVANPIQGQLSIVQSLLGATTIVFSFAAASWLLEWWKARRSRLAAAPTLAAQGLDPAGS